MAVANGFGKVVTSGSVFMYDTGDTVNSYKGKPTTNRFSTEITDPTLDSLAIGNGASSNPQLGSGGTCVVALFNGEKVLAINRGTSSGVYYENRVYWSIPLTTGNYYSWSAWVYSTVAGPILQLEYYGGDYNWGVAQSYNTHTGTGWERLYAYTNAVASSNTQTYCFIYINTNNTIYVKDFQLENQIYPTQFTTGTRSATQGLLPIVGNSTLDLSNVSFDSNAQIVFDGTDDYISLPNGILQGTGDFTINQIIESTAGNQGGTTFGSYPSSNLQIFYGARFIGMYLGNNSTYLGTSPWSTTLPEFTTSPTMITAVRSGSVLKFYINGELKKTGSSTSTVGTSTTLFRIGSNTGGTERFNGKIFTTHLYNRELSETEVKQNYNKYKTRFNLS
jgi:hypothetical protein